MPRWYHLTRHWKDKRLVVSPRTPTRVPSEPQTPRICVCPTVAQCIVALGAYYDCGKVRVYTCEADAVPAHGVFDADITGEHWILAPVEFTYAGKLNLEALPYFKLDGLSDEELRKNALDALKAFQATLK